MTQLKKISVQLASIIGIFALLATGCTTTVMPPASTPAPAAAAVSTPAPAAAAAANVDFETQLAGGKLGYPGIAVIGGGEANRLWIVDGKYHKIIDSVQPAGPLNERTKPADYPNLRDTHAIVFSFDFTEFYTVDEFDYDEGSWAIKYNTKTLREIARVKLDNKGGHHSALTPDGKYLYVANQYSASVTVIDAKTMTKIKDLHVGEGSVYLTPSMYWDGKVIDTPYLFVSVGKENKITAIDWKTNEIVKDIPVGGALHGVNLTPDGKQVWVAVGGAKKLTVVDVATLTVIKDIPMENGPIHLVFSPDGKFAFTATGGNLIFKIDTKTYETVWKSVGTTTPAHLGVSPDGKELWTLNHGMDTTRYPYLLAGRPVMGIQVWDTDDGKLITEMPFEAMPHEIQFIPYSALGVIPPKDAPPSAANTVGGHDMSKMDPNDVMVTYRDTLFSPTTYTVKEGATVHFQVDNQDKEDHVFGSVALKIKVVATPAGKITQVDWKADVKPGTYKIECEIHPGMDATLIVN
jgi:YVTN family beta-propeller protein